LRLVLFGALPGNILALVAQLRILLLRAVGCGLRPDRIIRPKADQERRSSDQTKAGASTHP
jgi:hypothetical protein